MEIEQADSYSSKMTELNVFYATKCLNAQVTIVSAKTVNREEQEEENKICRKLSWEAAHRLDRATGEKTALLLIGGGFFSRIV